MSSLFGALKNDGLEESQDRLGGYQPLSTDIYTGTIKMAYAGQSVGGAQSITLIIDLGGKEYRETLYITNKKGENWYCKKDSTKKIPMAGFTTIDDICLVTTGSPLSEQDHEDKVIKLYDATVKQEVNKAVPMLTGLLGKEVSLGILQNLENKNEKQGSDWVATADTKTTNTIDKVWHTETKMTVAEARGGSETGAFWGAWLAKNKDQVRDKRTIKDGATAQVGRPGSRAPVAPPIAGASQAPRKSLFGARA
jgi:hypothetical protein